MLTFVALALGYSIGSFPTAFLLVKRKAGTDIRSVGSGNVGGYNAYTVTGSKSVGALVIAFDAAKGLAVALAAWAVAPADFLLQAAAIVGVILGHNYPLWLKFKGGRGLATALGAMFGVGHFLGVAWIGSWLVLYRLRKDILRANVLATIFSLAAVWIAPQSFVQFFMIRDVDTVEYAALVTVLDVLFLVSHRDAIKAWNTGAA